MRTTLTYICTAAAAAALLAGCGSSSKKSTSSTSASSSSTPATSATTSTTSSGTNKTQKLRGSTGTHKATLAEFAHVTIHKAPRAHFSGLDGLTLEQKLQTFGSSAANFWSPLFTGQNAKLGPATINIIDQTPASCGGKPVGTNDPPVYCEDGNIDLTLGFIQSNIAPIGDAAVALNVSDLYGYHVINALGGLNNPNFPAADVQKLDSCLSGLYFWSIQQHLDGNDAAAVNKYISEIAPPGAAGSSGTTATVGDLTKAFNVGIMANGKLSACLPSSSPSSNSGAPSSNSGTPTNSGTTTP